jgi:hypothetical protein
MKKIILNADDLSPSLKMMMSHKKTNSYTFEIIVENCFLCDLDHEKIISNDMVVATNCNYELVKSLPKMTTRYS